MFIGKSEMKCRVTESQLQSMATIEQLATLANVGGTDARTCGSIGREMLFNYPVLTNFRLPPISNKVYTAWKLPKGSTWMQVMHAEYTLMYLMPPQGYIISGNQYT